MSAIASSDSGELIGMPGNDNKPISPRFGRIKNGVAWKGESNLLKSKLSQPRNMKAYRPSNYKYAESTESALVEGLHKTACLNVAGVAKEVKGPLLMAWVTMV